MSNLTAATVTATSGIRFPVFTTATRPTTTQIGFTIYNSDDKQIQFWDGTQWAAAGVAKKDGSSAVNAASSLDELKTSGVTTDGVYWFKDSSSNTYQSYAKMSNPIDSNPWILAFNINTADANNSIGGIPHWDNTTFWTTANEQNSTQTSPWLYNVKTRAFDKYPVKDILFVVHKKTGYDTNATQLHGYSVYVNSGFTNQTLLQIFTGGNDRTLTSGGRKTSTDYSQLLNWNNNRPQSLGGDLFISGTINGYNNGSYNLMFNVTNNFNSSNYALARISTSGAAGNGNYGYTAGGVGVKHGHNGNWGGYAGYAPVSAYCDGKEIYGSSTSGINYLGGINPNSPFTNCMGGGNGVVNYNLALFVR